jgi:hypothetical protein
LPGALHFSATFGLNKVIHMPTSREKSAPREPEKFWQALKYDNLYRLLVNDEFNL